MKYRSTGEEKMLWQYARFANLVAVAALVFAASGMPILHAQEASAYVVTYIETAPAMAGQAAQLARRYAVAGREADGNLRFEALQRIDRPNQFAFVSVWKDQQAAQTYAASEAAKQFHDRLQPLLSAPVDERQYTGLEGFSTGAIGPTTSARDNKGTVYVVTHVDIIPPKKDDGLAALKDVSGPSRAEAGNLRYEILQQNSRPNHFTLVEAWRNHEAFEAHEVAAHTRKLRDLLLPLQGALYDERLYSTID
jgi:quinol monooxygenase YgiN